MPSRPTTRTTPADDEALNAQTPAGNTPTVPALSGAVAYATSYAQTHVGRTVAIIFATDGEPTSCTNNTIPAAVTDAQNALMGMPSIRTFVLGVGPSLTNLNQIAAAGGTMPSQQTSSSTRRVSDGREEPRLRVYTPENLDSISFSVSSS